MAENALESAGTLRRRAERNLREGRCPPGPQTYGKEGRSRPERPTAGQCGKKGGKRIRWYGEGVTKAFEGFTALEDVSFTVMRPSAGWWGSMARARPRCCSKTAAAVYRRQGEILFDGRSNAEQARTARQEILSAA